MVKVKITDFKDDMIKQIEENKEMEEEDDGYLRISKLRAFMDYCKDLDPNTIVEFQLDEIGKPTNFSTLLKFNFAGISDTVPEKINFCFVGYMEWLKSK